MIKLSLKPEEDGTFKRARLRNNQVLIDTISPFEFKQEINGSLDSEEQRIHLRKLVQVFKCKVITINKR